MKWSHILAGVAAVLVLTAPVRAQVTLNFDDLGPCSGTPLTTYGGWLAVAAGVTCQTGAYSVVSARSPGNYLRSGGTMNMSFMNGPVVFNGLYASGYGSYFLELMNGGNVVYSRSFLTQGSNVFVGPNAFGGQVDQIRLRLYQGYGILGVDDISFTPTQIVEDNPGDENDPADELVNQATSNPEPVSMLLMATGLGGVGALARRRRKNARTIE